MNVIEIRLAKNTDGGLLALFVNGYAIEYSYSVGTLEFAAECYGYSNPVILQEVIDQYQEK